MQQINTIFFIQSQRANWTSVPSFCSTLSCLRFSTTESALCCMGRHCRGVASRQSTHTHTYTQLLRFICLFCPLLEGFISILWIEAWDNHFLFRPSSPSSRPEVSIYSLTLLDWLVHLYLLIRGETSTSLHSRCLSAAALSVLRL